VVTAQGNVINIDGSQFGGGQPRRGLIGKNGVVLAKDVIAKAEAEMKAAAEDLGKLREEEHRCRQAIEEVAADLQECRHELMVQEGAIKTQNDQIHQLRKAIESTKSTGHSKQDLI
jgi:chromosome segregation ATPase